MDDACRIKSNRTALQNIFYQFVIVITQGMTWTRLFYVKNLEKAFSRVVPGKERTELPINLRYQAQIRKEFRSAGVPWIYNLTEPKMNPRDKRPKSKKR